MFTPISRAAAAFTIGALALIGADRTHRLTLQAQGGREHTLYVSVVDKRDAPVDGLGPRDFVVREGGARREVLRASRAADPIDIALLVDTSAAMEPSLGFLRQALSRFVELMHRDNNIAIIGLAQRPTILADYTQNLDQLKAGIGKVFPQAGSGMTLLDALVEVPRGLDRRDTPRAALVAVITDGPEHGNADDGTALKAIQKAGASFHAVTVGHFSSTMPDPERYRLIVLGNGTRRTGGRHDNLMAASGWPQALEDVARDLSSQYKVVYSRPESLIPPESVEVSLTRPGLSARATPARRGGSQP